MTASIITTPNTNPEHSGKRTLLGVLIVDVVQPILRMTRAWDYGNFRQRTLYSACLVCRTWRTMASEVLWEDICLDAMNVLKEYMNDPSRRYEYGVLMIEQLTRCSQLPGADGVVLGTLTRRLRLYYTTLEPMVPSAASSTLRNSPVCACCTSTTMSRMSPWATQLLPRLFSQFRRWRLSTSSGRAPRWQTLAELVERTTETVFPIDSGIARLHSARLEFYFTGDLHLAHALLVRIHRGLGAALYVWDASEVPAEIVGDVLMRVPNLSSLVATHIPTQMPDSTRRLPNLCDVRVRSGRGPADRYRLETATLAALLAAAPNLDRLAVANPRDINGVLAALLAHPALVQLELPFRFASAPLAAVFIRTKGARIEILRFGPPTGVLAERADPMSELLVRSIVEGAPNLALFDVRYLELSPVLLAILANERKLRDVCNVRDVGTKELAACQGLEPGMDRAARYERGVC
ncbi:hypothetical protein BDK51DRAFT_34622 [Blyttiomyces helicus]|uniref:Uncharacterized protein n=1 Tax=Blyttiomyces helicus TaxID=388810 RepID=A0A4P9W7T5_9FUNG|nr:hypothetical protein BDK51DRAFT_34622 [Blyttiomyces helicus]|eukprot:RKO88551.1 hypothetical protein BDK51DRAFT_34622 [Blyttiomyces helicus]